MARTLLLLTLAGVAAAFVPARELSARARAAPARAAVSMKVDGLIGAIPPMGYFDPLGLSKGKTLEQMKQFRGVELKHGRVAMAAMLGYWTQPFLHPLAASCHITKVADPVASGIELPFVGKMQILVFCAWIEYLTYLQKQGNPDVRPGDLMGAAEWVDQDEPLWLSYQQKELSNGRLAMVAFAGLIFQKLYFGTSEDLLFKTGPFNLWKYLGPPSGF